MNKKFHNDIITDFFSEFIEFISVIKKVYDKTKDRYVTLRFNGKEFKIDVLSENFSEEAIFIFIFFCNTSLENDIDYKCIEISGYINLSKEQILFNYKIDKDKDKKYLINNDVSNYIEQLKKIYDSLEYVFLTPDFKNLFKFNISKLISFFENIPNNVQLLKRKNIFEFLNTYYDILKLFFNIKYIDYISSKVLESQNIIESILIPILYLGTTYSKNHIAECSITAPISLHCLNMCYDMLNKLIQLNEDEIEPSKNIFLENVRELFQFHIIDRKISKFHLVSPDLFSKTGELKMSIKNTTLYDSYNQICISDFIGYIEKNIKNLDKNSEYNIAILGEFSNETANELLNYLKNILNKYGKVDLKLNISVYTVNATQMKNISLDYCDCKFYAYNNQILNPIELSNIFQKNDMIFFLDNCDLYNITTYNTSAYTNRIILTQYIVSDSYESNYTKIIKTHSDYYSRKKTNYKLFMLYEYLNVYSKIGDLKDFDRKINNSIIDFIHNISTKYDKKCYILLSNSEPITFDNHISN